MSDRTVAFTFDPKCIEAENVREFHPEIVGAATGALRTMLDPENDARAHRDADILAACAVSEALKALVTVADLKVDEAASEGSGVASELPRHVMDTPSARAAGDDPGTAEQEAGEQ